ncbi:MAG: hypothetical protein KDI63_04950 [Gammaproteobacteria bacterium]|nr:hypothetical protein [Gammaproteobacteria bacterium]
MNTLPQGLEIGKIINKLSDRIGGNFTTISGAWSAATPNRGTITSAAVGVGQCIHTIFSIARRADWRDRSQANEVALGPQSSGIDLELTRMR